MATDVFLFNLCEMFSFMRSNTIKNSKSIGYTGGLKSESVLFGLFQEGQGIYNDNYSITGSKVKSFTILKWSQFIYSDILLSDSHRLHDTLQ